jgi:tRNA(Ile)-lysidine synthase
MSTVLKKVCAFIDEHQLVQPGDALAVAVSGGPDSVCLLHVLLEVRPIYNLRLHVAHLNHQLRGPASDEDADFVARLAEEWGLPATVSAYDVPAYQKAHGLSLETAAREVRYAFLAGVAAQTNAAAITLGHTASDQVETVVIHWLRGAGPAGLRGMPPAQTLRVRPIYPPAVGQDVILPYVRLVRPLLPLTRAEVEDYCAAHALPFRDDLSNLDETILRNRVRRHLLPILRDYNPNLDATLRRAADAFAEVNRFLEAQVDAAWPAVVRAEKGEGRPGAITFDRAAWQQADPVIQRGLVREAVARLLWGAPLDLGWDHAEAVLDLVARGNVGAEVHLPHGLVAVLDYDALLLGRPEALAVPPDGLHLTVDWLPLAVPGVTALPGTDWLLEVVLSEAPAGPPETLDPPPSAHCVYLDADRAGPELALRRRRPGDRFRPLGLGGTRKLKDFLIDAHVPQRWRDGVPLLVAADDHILWVVGHRLAEDACITPATRRVLRLHIQHEES